MRKECEVLSVKNTMIDHGEGDDDSDEEEE